MRDGCRGDARRCNSSGTEGKEEAISSERRVTQLIHGMQRQTVGLLKGETRAK